MKFAKTILIGACLWVGVLAGGSGPALASPAGACSVTEARQDVAAAKRAVERAEARLGEARYVLRQTLTYRDVYGMPVARWVRLARRTGWSRSSLPTLMLVINRESRGDPSATNPSSGCAGLLQLHPLHWSGEFDPYVPRLNLRYGLKLWRGSSWAPWGF